MHIKERSLRNNLVSSVLFIDKNDVGFKLMVEGTTRFYTLQISD